MAALAEITKLLIPRETLRFEARTIQTLTPTKNSMETEEATKEVPAGSEAATMGG